MGMFDSMYDSLGHDWQTKAFFNQLDVFSVGDPMPITDHPSFQVGILGGPFKGEYISSYATIRGGILVSVNVPRDESLPLLSYGGSWSTTEKEN